MPKINYDLVCKTPQCEGKILNRSIETSWHKDSKPEHDSQYVVCPKCQVKGNWELSISKENAKPVEA